MLTVNKPAEGALHSKYLKANQSTTVSLSRSAFLAHTNSLLPLKLAKLEVKSQNQRLLCPGEAVF